MEYLGTTGAEVRMQGEGRGIEGYGAVFDVPDITGDVIVRGAFTETLTAGRPRMLWQHEQSEPIGVWDEAREDERGLFLRGRLAQTQRAREAAELVAMGALDGLSIGFRVRGFEWRGGARVLRRIDLLEVSLVTLPAQKAATARVRSGAKDSEHIAAMGKVLRAAIGTARGRNV